MKQQMNTYIQANSSHFEQRCHFFTVFSTRLLFTTFYTPVASGPARLAVAADARDARGCTRTIRLSAMRGAPQARLQVPVLGCDFSSSLTTMYNSHPSYSSSPSHHTMNFSIFHFFFLLHFAPFLTPNAAPHVCTQRLPHQAPASWCSTTFSRRSTTIVRSPPSWRRSWPSAA